MAKLTGYEAIGAKLADESVKLNKHNDPTEEERFDLTIKEAREIAREDPSLIWCEIEDAAAHVEEIAAAHLNGIEGGLAGAVAAVIAGESIDRAAGLDGDDHWALPEGVSLEEVRDEVRRQLREAVEEAQEAQEAHVEEPAMFAVVQVEEEERGRLTPISLRVPSDLLAEIDAAAERARQSRTAYLLTAAEERMRREREPTPRR